MLNVLRYLKSKLSVQANLTGTFDVSNFPAKILASETGYCISLHVYIIRLSPNPISQPLMQCLRCIPTGHVDER